MYAFMLMMVLGFAGLVIDLGLAYYRKVQLQNAADAIALAAAQQLNGTAAGVALAENAAAAIAATRRLGIGGTLPWDRLTQGDALRFSTDPDTAPAGWMTGGQARVAPAQVLYARFDMSVLDDAVHQVQPILMGVIGQVDGIAVGAVAVAGPTMLNVTPLAICARREVESTVRANTGGPAELLTYGFRYGVTYNLLKQNPKGITPAYFLVNPVTAPGAVPGTGDWDAIAPFMCAGKLAYAGIGSGQLHLRRPAAFDLFDHLNTRLKDQGPGFICAREGSPTDRNVRSFRGEGIGWQSYPMPNSGRTDVPSSARSTTENGELETVADLPPKPPGQSHGPKDYGSLWAYGPAKRSGGGSMARTDWPTLYPAAPISTWGSPVPYNGNSATSFTAGPNPVRAGRRFLHIPLLKCSDTGLGAAAPRAQVLAYGKFLLAATADMDEVPGEFTGIVAEGTLTGNVEVFQ